MGFPAARLFFWKRYASTPPSASFFESGMRVNMVPVSRIHQNPYQPRRIFDRAEMDRLVTSVRHLGVLVPVLVRPAGRWSYELVAGERRWRACKELRLKTVPAVVKRLSDPAMVELALVENMVRAPLASLEEAETISRLGHEYRRMNASQLGSKLGLKPGEMESYNWMAKLSPLLKHAIYQRFIEPAHARLLSEHGDDDAVARCIAWIVAEKISPAELESRLGEIPGK